MKIISWPRFIFIGIPMFTTLYLIGLVMVLIEIVTGKEFFKDNIK